MIEVVAGIIYSQDKQRILLSLRKPAQHQGDRWEFPGGKIDPDENQLDALSRELKEELAIEIDVNQCAHFQSLNHQYSDKAVRLHFWNVLAFNGEPKGVEGQRLQWYDILTLQQLHFPDANQPIVESLVRQG